MATAFFSKKEIKEFQAQENNIGNQFLEFLPVATALSPTDILQSCGDCFMWFRRFM